MPELNITISEVANGFILFAAVIGGIAALWKTLVLPGLRRVILDTLEPISREFAVNGGESLAKVAHRTELAITEVDKKVFIMDRKLDDHIKWSASVMDRNDPIAPRYRDEGHD